MTNQNGKCIHCYPSETNHLESKTKSLLDFYLGIPLRWLTMNYFMKTFRFYLIKAALEISKIIGDSSLVTDLDRSRFDNCILVYWDEAKRRNLKIFNVKIKGNNSQIFCVFHKNIKYYFDRNPINLINGNYSYSEAYKLDNKSYFKNKLLAHGFPCPIGKTFVSKKNAIQYGLKLGFPLVVKPVISTASIHVSFDIRSIEELESAIMIAKQINHSILVEQYIPGDVHRAVILDNQLIACAKRTPGIIIGNGVNTVEQLIDQKNKHPWRGEPDQLDCSLHKISKDENLITWLSKQKITLKTKLRKGQIIRLSKKMNVGNGADITNLTHAMHPDNRALLEKVHTTLKLQLAGFDFICEDISIPWHKQKFAIIEYNSLPGIGIHHYPSEGEPINVAGRIWDYVLSSVYDNYN